MILHDDDEAAVEFMLMDLYGALVPKWYSDYSAYIKGLKTASGTLVHFVRIYACAEKYLLSNLRINAAKAFSLAAYKEWNGDDFTLAVVEALDTTQDRKSCPLRASIREMVVEFSFDLCNTSVPTTFGKLMQERSDLAIAVASWLSDRVTDLEDQVTELESKVDELTDELAAED